MRSGQPTGHPELRAGPHDALTLELRSGLRLRASTRADDGVFRRFHELYDQAFVLPDEKEGIDGFEACLRLNHGRAYQALQRELGVFREWVAVLELNEDGASEPASAGGLNLITFPLRRRDGGALLAIQLNYVFVAAAFRGRGLLRCLLDACKRLARASFESAADATDLPILIFLEQNDPLRMSADEYQRESRYSGTDQVDRLRIWQHLGAALIDFPYVQPALSAEQSDDHGLLLAVIGAESPSLDACLLAQHLARFFAISVLKGAPLPDSAQRQLALCEQRCDSADDFDLLDAGPWLRRIGVSPPCRLDRAAGDLLSQLAAEHRNADSDQSVDRSANSRGLDRV